MICGQDVCLYVLCSPDRLEGVQLQLVNWRELEVTHPNLASSWPDQAKMMRMTRPKTSLGRTEIWLHSIRLPQRIWKMTWLLLSSPYMGFTTSVPTSGFLGWFGGCSCKSLAMIEPKNGCCPGPAAVATFHCVRCWPRGTSAGPPQPQLSPNSTRRTTRAQCDPSKHMVKSHICCDWELAKVVGSVRDSVHC